VKIVSSITAIHYTQHTLNSNSPDQYFDALNSLYTHA
jgi:hypothetical protein